MKESFQLRQEGLILFVLGIILLFPSIGSETSITGQDEYWLSLRTPLETMAREDWFTPWLNGEPRLRKPPLLYWLMILSYKLLGINLVAARIWGVLAGAGLAALTCLFHRELFGKSGLLAGLMTLGTLSIAIEGRRAMLDLPLAFLVSSAVYFALRWGKSGEWDKVLLSAFCLGLSFLIKGPVCFLFFGAAIFGALWAFKKWGFALHHKMQLALALLLTAALCLPWPLAMAYQWPDFLTTLDQEKAALHLGTPQLRAFFSALGGTVGLAFPWSLILMVGLIWAMIRWDKGPEGLWLALWFLGALIPCLFMKTFSRYMVPTIPAAAMLCAHYLEKGNRAATRVLVQISILIFSFPVLIFIGSFMWFGLGLASALITLFLVGLTLWIAFRRTKLQWITFAVAILLTFMLGFLYPSLEINSMPKDLETRLVGADVATFNTSQPSMLSMRMRRSVIPIRSFVPGDLDRFKGFQGFVFVQEADVSDFEKFSRDCGINFHRAGEFRTFYSRQTWIRFAREDAGWDDWKKALATRSLEGLKPWIFYYRVSPGR